MAGFRVSCFNQCNDTLRGESFNSDWRGEPSWKMNLKFCFRLHSTISIIGNANRLHDAVNEKSIDFSKPCTAVGSLKPSLNSGWAWPSLLRAAGGYTQKWAIFWYINCTDYWSTQLVEKWTKWLEQTRILRKHQESFRGTQCVSTRQQARAAARVQSRDVARSQRSLSRSTALTENASVLHPHGMSRAGRSDCPTSSSVSMMYRRVSMQSQGRGRSTNAFFKEERSRWQCRNNSREGILPSGLSAARSVYISIAVGLWWMGNRQTCHVLNPETFWLLCMCSVGCVV